MSDISNAAFKLGEIVVLKNFPESIEKIKNQEPVFLHQPPSLIPPFMVISKVFCNQQMKSGYNESTGFNKGKIYFYQCHWYDAVNGLFRTKRFYEPLLQSIDKTKIIDNNQSLTVGSKVILGTYRVETLKKYAADNPYVRQRDLLKFLPPVMLVTDLSDLGKTETKDKNVQCISSHNAATCMWYNAAKGKYETEEFPLDILELP